MCNTYNNNNNNIFFYIRLKLAKKFTDIYNKSGRYLTNRLYLLVKNVYIVLDAHIVYLCK